MFILGSVFDFSEFPRGLMDTNLVADEALAELNSCCLGDLRRIKKKCSGPIFVLAFFLLSNAGKKPQSFLCFQLSARYTETDLFR